MYLRAVGRRLTQMIAYFLVMNSKRCNYNKYISIQGNAFDFFHFLCMVRMDGNCAWCCYGKVSTSSKTLKMIYILQSGQS